MQQNSLMPIQLAFFSHKYVLSGQDLFYGYLNLWPYDMLPDKVASTLGMV